VISTPSGCGAAEAAEPRRCALAEVTRSIIGGSRVARR
jgi:hypothetical protein